MWLSYTHQWADPRFQALKAYCMASVDGPEQREVVLALGWKTFRVRTADEPLLEGEFVCPKSEEAGRRLLCLQCKACSGARGKERPRRSASSTGGCRTNAAASPRTGAASWPPCGARLKRPRPFWDNGCPR